ncbi:organic solute transporter Ostalpha-domain-containing protein [Schizophyllum amplum]|uniref:Organic solute transporter Ostalpha-domain-containing protein n=1 Tax=Schizophyllum amplum TaxID=97359 RepID=A0A550CB47_9AGAR|nr:organic solute transporter Ostalpha-domain-containing protein [Auriculariopsis ampla]
MNEERCYKEVAPDGPSLLQDGNLVFQAHHIGWIVAGFFTLIACGVSFWLIDKHLQWYTNKHEQRHIVRILFLVPIYAVVSLASYFFWNHSTPIILVRDCYESTVLTSFFYLLLLYLSPDPQTQQIIFAREGLSYEADRQAILNGTETKKWVLPLGWVKWKPADGLYFLQLMKWAVLQYCLVRPLCTLAAVILDYAGLYCEESWGIGWGHIYLTIIISLSVTVAMYCLLQLYVSVSEYLAPQKPLLKLFAIKAVVFLTFWQATFLSVLTMFGVVKDTKYMTAADINIGIGALLETFEMACFALLHVKAFTYKAYRPYHPPDSTVPPPERTPRLRSLGHAFDFRETLREIWVGWKYMWQKMHGREPKLDVPAKRQTYYESIFGRPRIADIPAPSGNVSGDKKQPPSPVPEKRSRGVYQDGATLPNVQPDDLHDDLGSAERQWLGDGDSQKYGLNVGYLQREPSEGLEKQIEKELLRRGYTDHIPGRGHIGAYRDSDHRQQRSWWRSIYHRVSQTGQDSEDPYAPTDSRNHPWMPSRTRGGQHRPMDRKDGGMDRHLLSGDLDLDDPPPPTLWHSRQRARVHSRERYTAVNDADLDDTVAPLSLFKQRGTSSRPSHAREDATAHTPHRPYLQPSPQPHARPSLDRADSMMARVFPHSQNPSSTEVHHAADSVQSLPSVSADGVTPSRATPRARLVLGSPMPAGLSMAGERVAGAQVAGPNVEAQMAEVVRSMPVAVQPGVGRSGMSAPEYPTQAYSPVHSPLSATHSPRSYAPTSSTSPRSSQPPRGARSPRHSSKRSVGHMYSDVAQLSSLGPLDDAKSSHVSNHSRPKSKGDIGVRLSSNDIPLPAQTSNSRRYSQDASRYSAGASSGLNDVPEGAALRAYSHPRSPDLRSAGAAHYPGLFSPSPPRSPKNRPVPQMPTPLARPASQVQHLNTPPERPYDPLNLGGDIYFARPS